MKKFLLIFIFLSFVSQGVFAKKINIPEVSNNKIWVYYNKQAKVNYIAFNGGGGMKGNPTKSGNPILKFGKDFREAGSNYYIFSNPKKKKKQTATLRRICDATYKRLAETSLRKIRTTTTWC